MSHEPTPCGLLTCARPADLTTADFAGDECLCLRCASRVCCLHCALTRGASVEIGACECVDMEVDAYPEAFAVAPEDIAERRQAAGREINDQILDSQRYSEAGAAALAKARMRPDATVASEIGARS